MSSNSTEFSENSDHSNTSSPESWEKAWLASPGPRTFAEHVNLFIKGLGMGTADIVPGVSGGTIAFITGIYQSLLTAISSINGEMFRQALHLQFKAALAELHLRFLLTLVLGIAVALDRKSVV